MHKYTYTKQVTISNSSVIQPLNLVVTKDFPADKKT